MGPGGMGSRCRTCRHPVGEWGDRGRGGTAASLWLVIRAAAFTSGPGPKQLLGKSTVTSNNSIKIILLYFKQK